MNNQHTPLCAKSRLLTAKPTRPVKSRIVKALDNIAEKPVDPRLNKPAKVTLSANRIKITARAFAEAGVDLSKK